MSDGVLELSPFAEFWRRVEMRPSRAAQTFSAAAALSLLFGNPAHGAQQEDARQTNLYFFCHAPSDSSASFQNIGVIHGTAPTTRVALADDPWDDLHRLKQGWDGGNAAPIAPDAINYAKHFAKEAKALGLAFVPFADPDGNVGLESTENSRAAYLIVSPQGRFSYVIRDGEAINRGDNVDAATMRGLLMLLHLKEPLAIALLH